MAQTVREVMTSNPRVLDANDTAAKAAEVMRDDNVGALVVTHNKRVDGIVTDRDIAVRAVADGRNPAETPLREIASRELVALSPSDTVERAAEVMRERSVRRLPVVEGDRPVGIVSLGDLALERDSESTLAEISAAPGNN